ncbi:MAG: hypothetical protein JWO76_1871, partial [Nocardioides sp.]|nr:hypothetical protein [Nocardioides sp.]
LLPALVAVVVTLAAPLATAPAAATTAPSAGEPLPLTTRAHARPAPRAHGAVDESPLEVTIDALSPSYVPSKGPVRISGRVTNNDTATWRDISTFAFMSDSPITSAAELADDVALPENADVGDRITVPGTYDTIDELSPGQTESFSIRVPRALLPAELPGVYWFGVHALGEGPDGRIDGADGRARTFIPLVDDTPRAVDTALVVPLRREITHAADGSLEDVEDWARTFSPEGRLRSLVEFGASADSRPITWLLDPALPDAARSLALGNPPRSLAPTVAAGTADPSADPDVSLEPDDSGAGTPDEDPAQRDAAAAASSWLDLLHEGLGSGQVLALPYGDLDVAAAAERSPGLYTQARKRSGTTLAPWGLRMSPAVATPGGYLNPEGIAETKGATVLVTDRMFRGQAPPVARSHGARLVPTSSGAAAGGTGPGPRLTALSLRQRILSEAALRLLHPGRHPLVVLLPQHWSPGASASFFEGLDVDWVHLTTVADAADRNGRAVPGSRLVYPARQARRELDAANFTSAQALIDAGQTLQNVLTNNTSVGAVITDEALTDVSYANRRHPDSARAAADRSRAWVDQQLGSIGVSAPPAVTLSSTSGRFAATLTNGLDQPVSVSIRVQADRPLDITVPTTVDIDALGHTTVLLNASTSTPGIHNVRLVVTDTDGTPLGGSDDLPIKSAPVSGVIWLILGAGVVLLFGAIAVRLFRRIRAAAKAARAAAP